MVIHHHIVMGMVILKRKVNKLNDYKMKNEEDKILEFKEENNVWLFLYRYTIGDPDAYPNLCPLTWTGLLGLILILLSPFTLIYHLIKSRKYSYSFLYYLKYNELNGYKLFLFNLGILFLYSVMVLISIGTTDFGLANLLYLWLIPLTIFAVALTIGCSIILTIYNVSDSSVGESIGDNFRVMTTAVSSNYYKYCPQINWVKKEIK